MSMFQIFNVAGSAVSAQSQRLNVVASNLANADTPNYKARDLDFRAALSQAGAPGSTLAMNGTSARHLGTAGAQGTSDDALRYRTPLAPSLDTLGVFVRSFADLAPLRQVLSLAPPSPVAGTAGARPPLHIVAPRSG